MPLVLVSQCQPGKETTPATFQGSPFMAAEEAPPRAPRKPPSDTFPGRFPRKEGFTSIKSSPAFNPTVRANVSGISRERLDFSMA